MKTNRVFLSYTLSNQLTAYRNGRRLEQELVSSITRGDVSNHTAIRMSLHFGTHIDFPRHFLADGKTIEDYEPDFFVMDKVIFICPGKLSNPHLLSVEDIEPYLKDAPKDTLCILIKSGMGHHRLEDCYWGDNVGLDTGVAEWLRTYYHDLRFLGLDFISVSGSHYRELGRQVHIELLKRDILPIEDMNLEPLNEGCNIKELIVSPLRIHETEAAPVTVIANIL